MLTQAITASGESDHEVATQPQPYDPMEDFYSHIFQLFCLIWYRILEMGG